MKQLRHHRRHAAKMPGPRHSIQPVAHAFNFNKRARPNWIHLLRARRKHQIHALSLQQRAIRIPRPRILREVLIRSKLCGIHKDRHHHRIALLSRRANQRHMARMQRPHRRNQTDSARQPRAIRAPPPAFLQLFC